MVTIYVKWIRAERMTIEDVPERWRVSVEEALRGDK